MPDDPKPQTILPQPQQVQMLAQVQVVYTNGINLSLSQSDVQLTLNVNGRPSIAIAMGLSTAKSLVNGLTQALNNYEPKTGTSVLDLVQVAELLKKTI